MTNYTRDGQGTTGERYGGSPNHWPNSVAGTPEPDREYVDPAWALGEMIVDRFDSTVDHDDYTQAGDLYRLFDEGERERLTTRIAGALGNARPEVQHLQVAHFLRADVEYGRRVGTALGISQADLDALLAEPISA